MRTHDPALLQQTLQQTGLEMMTAEFVLLTTLFYVYLQIVAGVLLSQICCLGGHVVFMVFNLQFAVIYLSTAHTGTGGTLDNF